MPGRAPPPRAAKRPLAIAALMAGVVLAAPVSMHAQGDQAGTLKGVVRTGDATAVPGVRVTASSPALQGQRTATTGPHGSWILRQLPPGPYNVGLRPIQAGICADLGYPDCFTSQTIYFGRRGGVRFPDATILDFTADHRLPLWRDLDLWIKLDLFNIFDDATQTSGRTGVTADLDGPLDSLGLPTTFTPDPDSCDPVNNA